MTTAKKSIGRCVTYCRISADRFGEGAGVERQTVDTDRLADELGLTVIERVTDNDRSASKYARRTREGFARVLELLEGGTVDAVVAYDLDRLTRQPDELAPLIRAAERGVKVYTVAGAVLDLSSDDGIFTARVLLAVAEKEAANASRRQRAKLRHDAEAGRPHWPRRPFGYTMQCEIVPDEAEVLRWMYRRAIEGASATSIAVQLEADGVSTTSGARWQGATVKTLLVNPRNAGLRTYHGEIVGPAVWAPIVDEATWRDACAALALRDRPKRGGKVSLLTGLVTCSVCGKQMYRSGTHGKSAYRCEKSPPHTGCGNSMKADPVDEFVSEMVLVRLGDVVGTRRQRAAVDGGDDLVSLSEQLDELAAMLGRGELSMREYKSARAPLQARLQAAESAATRQTTEALLADLGGPGAPLRDRWGHLEIPHRHRLVRLVVERVEISACTQIGARLDLDRVNVIWKG